jgi:hypothetical protein
MIVKYKDATDDIVWAQVHSLRACGVPVKEIAETMDCGRNVIYYCLSHRTPPSLRRRSSSATPAARGIAARRRLVRKLATQSDKIHAKKTVQVRGRPRKDGTPRASFVVEKVLVKAKYPSPAAVSRELAQSHGIKVGRSTVRRDMESMGFRAYRRPAVCALTIDDQKRRRSFVSKVLRFPQKVFNDIVFTDEKWFDSNDRGDLYQWSCKRSAVIPRERIQAPAKVFVWGAIGVGWRYLKVVDVQDEGLNAQRFREECLATLPRCKSMNKVLMQDGARVHWTEENIEYIHKTMKMKTLEDWPPHSPDLNPIEHMWSIVQRAVSQRGPWGKEELVKYVLEEWERVPVAVVNRLVLSFRTRCVECRTNGGRQVKEKK